MKKILFLAILLFTAACDKPTTSNQAVVNLDYANTSLGFRNSGALSSGRLMLWDTKENKLITLATDIPLKARAPTTPVRMEATSVRGGQISANVDLTDKANGQISSEIRNNLSFIVVDAVRIDNTKLYSAISAAYKELRNDGVNARKVWRIDDAVAMPARYKFVVLRDEVRASEESISYDRSTSGKASFTVVDEIKGAINVSFPSKTTSKCSGVNVVCYINATVLSIHLTDAKTLDYAPVSYSRTALAQALRDLG